MTQHSRGGGRMAPIAVIGMSCRLPGAADLAQFWENLASGTESVGPVPEGRWADRDARGGFLARVDEFDAGFFGISHREAQYMDPRQRLLLELAWECVEDAAVAPRTFRGPAGECS